MKRRFILLMIVFAALSGLYAQSADSSQEDARNVHSGFITAGGETPAERYFLWARHEYDAGRLPEARAALEKATDFADELSDISFLRAKLDEHEQKSRAVIVQALERSLSVSKWKYYSEAQARFMAAEYLIALRRFQEAYNHLARIPDSGADTAELRLIALKGMSSSYTNSDSVRENPAIRKAEFRRVLLETMDRYPRDPRPARIFFEYIRSEISANAGAPGSDTDNQLLEHVLRQLPLVVEAYPELAWLAAPFIRDREEARRLLGAYRAGSLTQARPENFRPNPWSIIPGLELSLISDEQAVEELFGLSRIDSSLIEAAGSAILGEGGRRLFMQKLLSFSGVITADDDRDGIAESRAVYHDGAVREYYRDHDQDGINDLYILCINSVPQWAHQALPNSVQHGERTLIQWEQYPSVLRVEAGGAVYILRPLEFQYTPVFFDKLSGSETLSGLLFPRADSSRMQLRGSDLLLYALQIQRPSAEFEGAVEWIDMAKGVPWRSAEFLNGQPVSITEFDKGQPLVQWVDLDRDSRMETVRRFRQTGASYFAPDYQKIMESSMSDWNGDGLFEYVEEYLSDGSIVYHLDMDGSGAARYEHRGSAHYEHSGAAHYGHRRAGNYSDHKAGSGTYE